MKSKDMNENGSAPFSEDLEKRVNKNKLTSEQAKRMVALAKKSPKHGKHGKLKKTLLKEEAFRQIQEKLIERSLGLINTQTVLAHGAIKVFKIVTVTIGSGKNAKTYKEKPVLVANEEEIAAVIDYQFGDGTDDPSDDEEFFFVVTQDPDNSAIRDQLNRVFGKPDGKVDITSKGQQIKSINIVQPS